MEFRRGRFQIVLMTMAFVVVSPAWAQITVTGPFVDETTRGDWRGTYGECFFLLPQPPFPEFEFPVGPDAFSLFPNQYQDNCWGGELFTTGNIDWRIFMTPSEIEAFLWSYREDPTPTHTIRAGTSQWNPCLADFANGTWDNEVFFNDPMCVELTLTSGGAATLAYYLLNGDVECRELDYSLMINGAGAAAGTIGDFAGGKYVVFGLDNIPDGVPTVVKFCTSDAAGTPTCDPPAEINAHNSVVSGVFINGTNVCAPPPGGEGCTPGYWKNHLEDWPPTGLSPADDFDTTFGVDLFSPDITLDDAIRLGGGGVRKLARHGTAALLSAAHPDVSYPFTTAQVIAFVQAGDVDPLAAANELGCDIP